MVFKLIDNVRNSDNYPGNNMSEEVSDDDHSWDSDEIQSLVSNSEASSVSNSDSEEEEEQGPRTLDLIIDGMTQLNMSSVPSVPPKPFLSGLKATPVPEIVETPTAAATSQTNTSCASRLSNLPPPVPRSSFGSFQALDKLLCAHPANPVTNIGAGLTHLSMNGGKYDISKEKEEANQQFLKLYFDCVVKDSQYRGKARYLVEAVSKIVGFYYFLDFDFTQEDWVKMVYIAGDRHKIYQLLHQVISKQLDRGSDQELIFSIRFPWKIHVNAPGYIVSSGKAAKLTDQIKKEIIHYWQQTVDRREGIDRDKYISINFDKAIDCSVYRTGLRMLGAIKKSADSQVKQLNQFLAKNQNADDASALLDGSDFVDSYFIVNMETGQIIKYEDTTFELFKKTLVRPYTKEDWEELEEIGKKCALMNNDYKSEIRNNTTIKQKKTLRSIRKDNQGTNLDDDCVSSDDDEDEEDTASVGQFMSDKIKKDVMILREIKKFAFNHPPTNTAKKTAKDDFFTYIILDDDFKIPISNEHLVAEVQDHLKALKATIFDKTFGKTEDQQPFKDMDLNVETVKIFRKDNQTFLHVDISDRQCPFIRRCHTRTSNPIYLNLYSSGFVEIRCFDDQCRQERFPTKRIQFPFDRKHQYIYHVFNCNNLAIEIHNLAEDLLFNNSSDLKVSQFVYYLFRHLQVADVDGSKTKFYTFSQEKHKWVEYVCFQSQIMSQVPSYLDVFMSQYMLKHLFVNKPINVYQFDEKEFKDSIGDKGELKNLKKAYSAICFKKLQSVLYVNKILPNVGELMLNDYLYKYPDQLPFKERLDSNPSLMVFKNGVFDFEECVFRPGRRADYCSINLDFDFLDFDDPKVLAQHQETIQEIQKYFNDLFPEEEIREYMMNVVARALYGKPDERFTICVGSGSNGKSFFFSLLERMLKTYTIQMPVTIFTQKRGGSENASPVLTKLKAKRICLLQEPDKDDVLYSGLLKLLSGGDKITTRKLYGEPMEFINQSTFLLAANQVPKISSSDGGLWRRLRIVPFTAKFVRTLEETNDVENAVVIDPDFEKKTFKWPPMFVSFFIQRFKRLHENNPLIVFDEPPQVLEATRNEQGHTSMYLNLVNDLKISKKNMKANGQLPKGVAYYTIEALCEYMKAYLEKNGSRFDSMGYNRQSLAVFFRTQFGEPVKKPGDHFKKGYYLKVDKDIVKAMMKDTDYEDLAEDMASSA